MHRNVGVLFALLTVQSLRVFAAGNIGCLFSDTLCEQEREWCFDDHAFGHCLSKYVRYHESDLHRYDFDSHQLYLLEHEMQRLFLEGYRWSHTYTQCVLQHLLKAIAKGNDFDRSACNNDEDQDLEGALKAIEGEERVDPRDLAIVRFMPSATDPHSDYADEVYFPPIKNILEGTHSESHDGNDQNENDGDQDVQDHDDRQESPPSEPDPNDYDDYDSNSEPDPNMYRSRYHYQTPMNPVYRKRNWVDNGPPEYDRSDKMAQLRRIANILHSLSDDPDPLLRDEVEDSEDTGVFGEKPAQPMYSEAGFQGLPRLGQDMNFLDSSVRNGIMPQYVPEDLQDDFHRVPVALEDHKYPMAFRNLPRGLINFPGPYDTPYLGPQDDLPPSEQLPPPIVSENSINRLLMQDDVDGANGEPVGSIPLEGLLFEDDSVGVDPLGRGGNKISQLQTLFAPQFAAIPNNVRDEDDYRDYSTYDLNDDYGDYGEYDDEQLEGQRDAFPLLQQQKFVKKDEETAGDDYEMFARSPWNFQRNERLDTKKPGPGYNVNNYAFDRPVNPAMDGPYDSEYPQDSPGEEPLMLRRLKEESPIYAAAPVYEEPIYSIPGGGPGPVSDLLLADEGIVDEATEHKPTNDKIKTENDAAPEDQQSTQPTEVKEQELEPQQNSHLHISIKEGFKDEREGENLAKVIAGLSGLNNMNFKIIRIEKNKITCEVSPNKDRVTASDVAKIIEEQRGKIFNDTGLNISEAGVGDETTMSAIVFSSSEKHILAAAAIVCGVMAALLVAASTLFFLRKNAKSKAKLQGLTAHDTEPSKDYQDLCRARMAVKSGGDGGKVEAPTSHAPSQRVSSLSRDSDNGNNSPSSRSSTSSCEEPVTSNMDISTGHMVLSYMEDHLKNKDRLEQEWIALCAYEAEPCATTLAMKPENKKKNRYPDAVPYDHKRVVLTAHTNVNGSDYINASSITDHDPRNPAYIATQGPLQSTAADFWQMVWEQGSVVIVMLTRLTENGLAFCHRYWPEEGSELYHVYEVHLVSEHIWCDDYLVRSFYLKNVKTGETRTVTQFHFLSWPDSGTPASTKALLEFRRKVNKSYRGRSCPIIVHCSDGIGRTGTYSLIDMVLNRMAKGAKEIDIAATLEHIRDQRPHMVKSKSQFEFVLMAVAEEVHAILKALPQ